MSISSLFSKISSIAAVFLLAVSLFSVPAQAQGAPVDVSEDWLCNLQGANCPGRERLGATDIPTFIGNAIGFALPIIIVIGVAMLLFGAFQLIIGKNEEGRGTITNTLIGIVVALLAVTLVAFVVGLVQGL